MNIIRTPRTAKTIGDHPAEDVFDTPRNPIPDIVGRVTPLMANTGRPISDGAIYSAVSREEARRQALLTNKAHQPASGLKVYLAGPMTGIKEFNFPAFMAAAYLLRRHGHEVFNPAEEDIKRHGGVDVSVGMSGDPEVMVTKHKFSLRDALRDDTHYICTTANAIAMLPGWEASKGARAEHALAFALGHQFIYLGGTYG